MRPYENIDLHYSSGRSISLDPNVLYNKFITRGQTTKRGGYCMELSLFFLWMLRLYGFDAYPTGVRIRLRENGVPQGDFTGLVHIVLIITFPSGEKYISDVGFGGDGITTPRRLIENEIVQNLGTQENRYIYSTLQQNPARKFSSPQKYWIWQYRNSAAVDWNSFYCFTEDEYLLGDFKIMNTFTSGPTNHQAKQLLGIKFLRGDVSSSSEQENEERRVIGKVMLVRNVIKRNMGGKTEIVEECHTEGERIEALKKWFGITLSEEEKAGIEGSPTQLPATS